MSNATILEAAKKVAQEVASKNPSLNTSACLMALPTISYPTGKKKLSKSETTIDGESIKGEALNKADLDWFPQDKLAPFNTIRKAAKAALIKSSVEVGGLFIVSVESLPTVMQELMLMQNEWDTHFNELVLNYEKWLDEHKNKPENLALQTVINNCSMTVGEFTSSFRFAINPAMKVETLFTEQSNSFAGEVALSLWDEVAKMADEMHKTLFLKNREGKLSQRGLGSVTKLRSKLINLSFVHDGVDCIVQRFDEVMSQMPKTGPVQNVDFYRVAHMVLQFSSASRLKAEADGLEGIEEYEDPNLALDATTEINTADTPSEPESSQVVTQLTDTQSEPAGLDETICQFEDEVVDPGMQATLDFAGF